ncbi:hypothetical protein QCM11_34 [Bacillus phage QCM11]|uniref:Uncharacterized protein n=2 Tax=Claudivirus TaxID=2842609 RepID=A0A1I9S6P9_9CAUD|nr:hypothetical protein MUK67_gp40 [Bacillus phage Claudi]YP_009910139.1 hypothetical protein H3008_gp34 [Bacillus phage QCM11]ANT41194.1 hypothetical protein CLAUDI_40 [Bacillus phage Claudi]AOZ62243.1 hypothetical protein QCM11_34 [Bacillus phage QCM11]
MKDFKIKLKELKDLKDKEKSLP